METLRNKEISWLSFNNRVLQEAADPSVPLIERIKFLGIYSSNLDEFFRVRVATLRRLSVMDASAKKIIGHSPKKVFKEIQEIVLKQNLTFERVYKAIRNDLGREKIFIVDTRAMDSEQRQFALRFFLEEVRPKLIPIIISPSAKFPNLRDDAIYLAMTLRPRRAKKKDRYALIELPTDVLPRFISLPARAGTRALAFLDDIVRLGLSEIFSIFEPGRLEAYTIKLTRDAELDIDDDLTESMVKKIAQGLKGRKRGDPVRLVFDARIPKQLLEFFIRKLHLQREDVLVPGSRYHNFRDFINFPDFGLPEMRYPALPKLVNPDLPSRGSLLQAIERQDILLHYCYQSFDSFIDLLREAAIDPHVQSIKLTIYRAARNSSVINSLINAARNGKAVTVVLELQARFDEEANLQWGNQLREESVRVVYGVHGLKVHAKAGLITRRQHGKTSRIAILGTGNFNEATARAYSDHCLFTGDERITREVDALFSFFESTYKAQHYRQLSVAPFNLRKRILKLIRDEVSKCKAGGKAAIFIKVNNLTDPDVIQALYRASRAGVPVRLIVRGMFSLIPGLPGWSENISAIRIVDRFLEHSRIFIFGMGAGSRCFLSSADLMTRNLDQRIETMFPIFATPLRQELLEFMEIQWRDTVKARAFDPDGANPAPPKGHEAVRAQWAIYERLANKKGRSTAPEKGGRT